MRERIEELELVAARWKASAITLSAAKKHAETRAALADSRIDTLKQALGDRFVGFEPRAYVLKELMTVDCGPSGIPESFRVMRGGDVLMCHALYQDTNVDRLHNQIHFHVRLAGSHAAYAMSEATFRSVPIATLARNIAREIATDIAEDLARTHRGRLG